MKKYLLISLMLILTGCASNQSLYYWGNYQETNYAYSVEPSKKTLLAYQNTLLDIIQKSNEINKKVPPGIYFELGLVYTKTGKKKEGLSYIEKERELYPESKVVTLFFMQRMNEG